MNELMIAALVVGTFSGVDLNHLMDTPIIGGTAVFEYEAEELAEHGTGFALEERDGRIVLVTNDAGFALSFEQEFQAGFYTLSVEAEALNNGSDSYWIVVDGEQGSQPLTLSIDAMSERSGGFEIAEDGLHTVGIILREAPGSAIAGIRARRNTITPPQEPMLPELAAEHPRLLFRSEDIRAMRVRL